MAEKSPQIDTSDTKKKKKWISKIPQILWDIVKYLFFLIILFTTGTYFLIKIPSFQNYAIQKITGYLSQTLGTTVSAGRVKIVFVQSLQLEDFLILDRHKDTLLYTKYLNFSLNGGLVDLLDGKVSIKQLELKNAVAHLTDYGPKYNNNYQFLLNFIENGHPDSIFSKPSIKKKNINLDLDKLNITNLSVDYTNQGSGKSFAVQFNQLYSKFKSFDLAKNSFEIDQLKIVKPKIVIVKNKGKPFIESQNIDPYATLRAELAKHKTIQPLHIDCDIIAIDNGDFAFDNNTKPYRGVPGKSIDFNHINLDSVSILVSNFVFDSKNINAVINQIALNTGTSLKIKDLKADNFIYTPHSMELKKYQLETESSLLRDQVKLSYHSINDMEDFVNKVNLAGRLVDSKVAVNDIVAFEPNLVKDKLFKHNSGRVLFADGEFYGTVNNLTGKNMEIVLDQSHVIGNIKLVNITNPKIGQLDINITQARTNANELYKLIPGFTKVPVLDKLGFVTFQGNYKGTIHKFNIDGSFNTALGKGSPKLNFDLTNGSSKAKYSGEVYLENYDLGPITGDNNLGKFTGTINVDDGKSFDINNLATVFHGKVNSLTYKGYQYNNAVINGQLKDKSFSGNLSITDENATLDFIGTFDFSKPKKILKFNTNIQKLNLKKLNLIPNNISLKGQYTSDLTFSTFDDLKGNFNGQNIEISDDKARKSVQIDYLNFIANTTLDNKKQYVLNSDLLDAKLKGQFKMEELWGDIERIFHKNHTKLADQFGIYSRDSIIYNHNFDFDISLRNTKNLFEVIGANLKTIKDGTISGNFRNTDSTRYSLYLNANIPEIKTDKLALEHCFIEGSGNQDKSEFFAFANNGNFNETQLNQMDLSAVLHGNDINFNIKTPAVKNFIENINLDANYSVDSGYNILRFNQSRFDFMDSDWSVNQNNEIRFGQNKLQVSNLRFTNGIQDIQVDSYGSQGMHLTLNKFSLGLIKGFLPSKETELKGLGKLDIRVDSIYSLKNLSINGTFDSILVNNIWLGSANLTATAPSLEDKLALNLTLNDKGNKFESKGFLTLPDYKFKDVSNNYLDLKIDAKNYPVAICEAFLGDMISNTIGTFSSNVNLSGPFENLNIKGIVELDNAATTINYLGTRYYITKYTTNLNNQLIDLDNLQLIDERGNIANVSGGIRHNKLKDFKTDIEITSPDFLLLNTTKKDNPYYYGTASGEFSAKFTGPFNQMNIDINAVTGPRTEFYLPTTHTQDVAAIDFIEFKNKFDTAFRKEINQLRASSGIKLTMNLDLNENASLNIIFDDATGDAIRGQGNGHLELSIPRNGNLEMYGTFEVASGEYQFTIYKLLNLSVLNTTFLINKGGTIVWNGDPFKAQINIDAYYKGLRPIPYNFIYEYLPDNDRLVTEANKPTPVDLTLHLDGDLLKPAISFDISFPQVSPELKTYTDSKLAYLAQNPNELNKQAAFLITLKSFIPENFSANAGLNTIYNTLSDLISSQLMQVLSPMINETLANGKILNNVDLNMAYVFYNSMNNGSQGITTRTGSEFQFGPKLSFFKDRLIMNSGIKTGSTNQRDSYVAGDIELQYALTPDRRYLLRVYNKSDAVLEGRRIRSGVGFTYQKSVDSFWDLFKFNRNKSKLHPRDREF